MTYFDFSDRRVKTESSRFLFAERGANSSDVEKRLNQVVEQPISNAMATLTRPASGAAQHALDPALYKSLSLLMMLQPLRVSSKPARNETLEQTIMKSDGELDALAYATSQAYHLGRIEVGGGAALLYPAAGFFPIVAEDPTGVWHPCIALPMASTHVVIAAPREVDWASASELWAANRGGMLSNYSVGTSDRVVLPPPVVASYTEPEIADLLTEMREGSTQALKLCRGVNELVARMNEIY